LFSKTGTGICYAVREFIMAEAEPGREEAFSLLRKYNTNEGLIKHALAVEAVML